MERKDPTDKKFESALDELEQVVEQLESGELSLEDSLGAFEKGVGLVRLCNQKLSEAEKKIEMLVRDKEGKLELKELTEWPKDDNGQ
jgi:exodeoxyribonuclease VII small subunit